MPQEAFKALDLAALKAAVSNSSTVIFATGGERGLIKLWRSDTGQCIHEYRYTICDCSALCMLTP